jgi:hypothetical protein
MEAYTISRGVLRGVASIGFGAGTVIALSGGGEWPLGRVVLRAATASRPLAIGTLATAVLLAVVWRPRSGSSRMQRAAGDLAAVAFGALLCAAAGMVLRSLVTACGGLDSYGYVSAAHLLLSGRLVEHQPLAALMPFDGGIRALTPLGYISGRAGDIIVPRFPLGFPLVIATSMAVFGKSAAWYVAPALAAGTTALSYLIARRITSSIGAILAAALVATSPVLVNSAIQPMSDVPAAFWLAAAVCGSLAGFPFGAGICAGLAALTRPPLLLAAIVIPIACSRDRRFRLMYAAGAGPAILALFALQWTYYGHPFMSGYGSAGELFTLGVVGANMRNYVYWLLLVVTPLVPVGIVLAFRHGSGRFARLATTVFAAVALPYIFYAAVYADWEVLRFLLPGLVPLLISCADGFVSALEHSRCRRWIAPLAAAFAFAAASASYAYLTSHGVFGLWHQEAKYPLVGEWFVRNTGAGAIAMSSLHSGSIRQYGNRTTVRWDAVPSGRLEETVFALVRHGHRCYLVLDGTSERDSFERRFTADERRRVRPIPVGRVREVDIIALEVPESD